MTTRRVFVTSAVAGIVAASTGARALAEQEGDSDIQLTNASFIRDLEAGAAATPESDDDSEDLRGYILGDPEAPNTLELYADYRCPHCRVFHREIEPGLIADFVATGRMNIELLDFTVIGVKAIDDLYDDGIESVQAAEAAACAAEQGAFLEYREWLYSGSERTSEGDFSDEKLIAAADEMGLDTDAFGTALADGVYEESLISLLRMGLDRGVEGTPFMILNGVEKIFLSAGGYNALKEEIETLLQ